MPQTILVINPNSTEAVTEGIDRALEPLRMEGGPEIRCLTLAEGPPGIESQADADSVVGPICRLMADEEKAAAAFVIACYSDPGLAAARETVSRPVFGIAEAAMATAITQGERFGILSILPGSIPRHTRAVRAAGLASRFAGDVAIGIGVEGLADENRVAAKMRQAGGRLKRDFHADVLILGCAGMARYRKELENELAIPVIEPTRAAVTMAIGSVRLSDD